MLIFADSVEFFEEPCLLHEARQREEVLGGTDLFSQKDTLELGQTVEKMKEFN